MKLRKFLKGRCLVESSMPQAIVTEDWSSCFTDPKVTKLAEIPNSPVFNTEWKIIFVVVGDSLANQEHQSVWWFSFEANVDVVLVPVSWLGELMILVECIAFVSPEARSLIGSKGGFLQRDADNSLVHWFIVRNVPVLQIFFDMQRVDLVIARFIINNIESIFFSSFASINYIASVISRRFACCVIISR